MSENSKSEDTELDLTEFLAAMWAHKLFIILVAILFVFLSGYYALNTQKKFTAQAVFQIEQNNQSGFSIPGELGALASLAGLSSGSAVLSSKALLERVVGREFIIAVNEESSLYQDRYFNTYDPNYEDPIWKAIIKSLIGWQKPGQITKAKQNAIIENTIVANYQKNVEFKQTNGGAIVIAVTHISPDSASKYANIFMSAIRRLVEDENSAAQNLRLSYLSETLADALQEVERTQGNLKNYALKNSALAQENFISGSLKLDEIRMEKRKVEEISKLLVILEDLIQAGNTDKSAYETLRTNQPLVDDRDFRRILGMSETISSWSWPQIETIAAVNTTLKDRINRLNLEIKSLEESAKIYATSAEDLAKLTRDAKIAEATYTVLIEQVKSQSLAAGFQPETFKVFEYATPPLNPSSPNRNLVLVLGLASGIFTGIIIALFNSLRRNVYFKASTLIFDTNAKVTLKSKSIKRFYRKSFSKINSLISNHKNLDLDKAQIQLANKKLVYVFNSKGKINPSDVARLLVAQSTQSGRKVLLCDANRQSENEVQNKPEHQHSELPFASINENISLIMVPKDTSFFTFTHFKSTIEEAMTKFDQIFICSDKENSSLGSLALQSFNPSCVLIAGLRSTQKSDIKKIKEKHQIDLLVYD